MIISGSSANYHSNVDESPHFGHLAGFFAQCLSHAQVFLGIDVSIDSFILLEPLPNSLFLHTGRSEIIKVKINVSGARILFSRSSRGCEV